MLRIVARRYDVAGAVNVGAPVDREFKTFDIEIPELEEYLTEHKRVKGTCYFTTEAIGIEVLDRREGEE